MAGGLCPERDVSLSSGSLIANALMENGHRVLLLDMYKGIEAEPPFIHYFTDKSSGIRFEYTVPETEPDLQRLQQEHGQGKQMVGKNVLPLCAFADGVFMALHGDIGENGKIQALLDIHGIQYTGTGYQGSCLAMDKNIAKQLLRGAGVPTPGWVQASASARDGGACGMAEFPCVVKPCSGGSSIGVSVVENPQELQAALKRAFQYEDEILIEQRIQGREFSVGILDGKALPPIEIFAEDGFYGYASKYQRGKAKEVCPADLSIQQQATLQQSALKVHEVLKLGGYSRVDYILGEDGVFYCLEANTLPGMTPTSLLPQEAAAEGIDFNALCEKILRLSVFGREE